MTNSIGLSLPDDFDSQAYLELNPDVREAGCDPKRHYLEFGHREGRLYKHIAGRPSDLDISLSANPKTKRSSLARHTHIWEWVRENCNSESLRVLEIGSRSVVSDALWKQVIPHCNYTGFDVLEGKNVTVVGDAHRLSEYFPANSFDLILSFAVFEHLAMPWIVAEEVSKILAPRGHVVIETHFSFSNHEQPWNFFHFTQCGLETLFCPELGFETIDSGLDTPIVGRFSSAAADYLQGRLVPELYCHSALIAQKQNNSNPTLWNNGRFDWRSIGKRISSESMYPIDSDMLRRNK